MRRRLFNFAAIVSLVLFVAAGAVWVRSYWRQGLFTFPVSPATTVHMFWARGSIGCTVPRNFDHAAHGGRLRFTESYRPTDLYAYWGTLPSLRFRAVGFAVTVGRGNRPSGVLVPCWAVALALCALPTLWVVRRIRSGHRADGSAPCPACGYDLRATPDRCPECGAAPAELLAASR
jgi:hypothetical protein